MNKIPTLLLAFVLIVAACNNNKTPNSQNQNNREKDDYGNSSNRNNENTNNTGSAGWAENDRTSFLKDCKSSFDNGQEDVANRICPCVLEKMEKEFASMNEANTKGGEAAGTRLALQCKEEILGNNNNNNNNTQSGWTSSDESKFMSSCEGTASKNVGAARANQYCDCMLQKLKNSFSSYDEANRGLGNKSQEEINQLAADCNR
jgi:hypothetical protein